MSDGAIEEMSRTSAGSKSFICAHRLCFRVCAKIYAATSFLQTWLEEEEEDEYALRNNEFRTE